MFPTTTGWTPTTPLALVVYAAGFEYDAKQDIIQSRTDAFIQSHTGFNAAYDEASAGLLMILDAEPFYFTYKGKRWMIELWKGQYGLETGAEIGVYNAVDHTAQLADGDSRTAGPGGIPRLASLRGRAHDAIHKARILYQDPSRVAYASSKQWLKMSFTLRGKDNTVLLARTSPAHWWLTGFKWGVFTRNTRDLAMDLEITLKDQEMYMLFGDAVVATGYDVVEKGNLTLGFRFVRPKTSQPRSRTRLEDQVQAKNEQLVASYCGLHHELGLKNNDPNGFDTLTLAKFALPKARQGIVEAAKKIEHDAVLAAKKLHHAVDAAVHHEVSEVSRTAYGTLLRFFENGWRATHSVDV